MINYEQLYNRVWNRVREIYDAGYCLSERGLQAALYTELKWEFPKTGIVVEPHWNITIPDVVIVSSDEITDIFELKFVPHSYPKFNADIRKLREYKGLQHTKLNPVNGRWEEPLPIRSDCRLHFVVVGNSESEAVRHENIPDRLFLWFGRISEQGCEWGVRTGTKSESSKGQ